MKNKKGFTLLEILLVIGIIATLAVIVFVALDPARRYEEARNSRRLSDIQNIFSAIQQYVVDNKGAIPPGIQTSDVQLGTATGGCEINNTICGENVAACVDLSGILARYLKEIPYDPQNGTSERTRYTVVINENNIITVKACDSTDAATASISR
jgi:prepilin-type N-terminal cleavage/methylation domain-containing protein